MEDKLILIMIISIVVLAIATALIFLLSKKKKITILLNKLCLAESDISENLRIKFDIIIRIINIIERELKIESKTFDEIKRINIENINNIVLDNVLTDGTNEIFEFRGDYKELSKTKSFDGLISDLKEKDIYLSGGRKFYNKYASLYNSLIKTFPTSVIANYKKLCNKVLYTENIMEENLKIDFTK